MPRTSSFVIGAIAATLTATAVFAASHNSPYAGAIKARQGLMANYALNIGMLGGMAQGKIEYNSEAAAAAASNIAALSKLNQMAMWPQGSDGWEVEGTRAMPEIWSNFADVAAKGAALSAAADAMAAAAGTDLAALQAAMGPLGAACGACHKAYRQPE